MSARMGGKYSVWLEQLQQIIASGGVVHVATHAGMRCSQPGHCHLPRWTASNVSGRESRFSTLHTGQPVMPPASGSRVPPAS